MTQIIVINDTGAQIPGATEITLDGVNKADPIEEILAAELINFCCADTTAATAIPTTITVTTVAPTTGYNISKVAINKIQLGIALETYQVLVLNVRTRGEIVRP